MTTLEQKINKLKTILEQVPKGTPTFTTIQKSLQELYQEQEKEQAKVATQPAEQTKPNEPTEATAPTSDVEAQKQTQKQTQPVAQSSATVDNAGMFQALGVLKGRLETKVITQEDGTARTFIWIVLPEKRYRAKTPIYKLDSLVKSINEHPDLEWYLKVYPRLYFKPDGRSAELGFQVNTWKTEPFANFEVNEFCL